MTSVEQVSNRQHVELAAEQKADKRARPRGQDKGAVVLPQMEHFVWLVRKVRRAPLLVALAQSVNGGPLPAIEAVAESAKGALPIASRNVVYESVAALHHNVQARLERAAERVNLLCDDFGALAVNDLLDANDPKDATLFETPSDKFSRALHLYLCQAYRAGTDKCDDRFDHAEARQVMLQQSLSEKYSSHYLGPKGVVPTLDESAETSFKQRLCALFPQIAAEDILVERFEHRDFSQPDCPIVLYTLSALFNRMLKNPDQPMSMR